LSWRPQTALDRSFQERLVVRELLGPWAMISCVDHDPDGDARILAEVELDLLDRTDLGPL